MIEKSAQTFCSPLRTRVFTQYSVDQPMGYPSVQPINSVIPEFAIGPYKAPPTSSLVDTSGNRRRFCVFKIQVWRVFAAQVEIPDPSAQTLTQRVSWTVDISIRTDLHKTLLKWPSCMSWLFVRLRCKLSETKYADMMCLKRQNVTVLKIATEC